MLKREYFFSRYFKLVSDDGSILILMPGIIRSREGIESSFLQLIDGVMGKAVFFQYPAASFQLSGDKLAIKIGSSLFYDDGISLKVRGDGFEIEGNVDFSDKKSIRKTLYIPDIMGPFAYLPFIKCRHDVINLRNSVSGTVNICGDERIFDDGCGYIEGSNAIVLPKGWKWLQAPFTEGASVIFATSPFAIGKISLPGFFACIEINGKTYIFANYTAARYKVDISETDEFLVRIEDDRYKMDISCSGGEAYKLRAPMQGQMQLPIIEKIGVRVYICLSDKQGNILFNGESNLGTMKLSN